jgi:hypothetical protein
MSEIHKTNILALTKIMDMQKNSSFLDHIKPNLHDLMPTTDFKDISNFKSKFDQQVKKIQKEKKYIQKV